MCAGRNSDNINLFNFFGLHFCYLSCVMCHQRQQPQQQTLIQLASPLVGWFAKLEPYPKTTTKKFKTDKNVKKKLNYLIFKFYQCAFQFLQRQKFTPKKEEEKKIKTKTIFKKSYLRWHGQHTDRQVTQLIH